MSILDLLQNAIINTEGKGADDKVPIMASEGEYVIPAKIVALLGDGNSEAGSRVLDTLIDQLDQVELKKGQKLMDILGKNTEDKEGI